MAAQIPRARRGSHDPFRLSAPTVSSAALTPLPLTDTENPGDLVLNPGYDATDPFILQVGNEYILYTTTGGEGLQSFVANLGTSLIQYTSTVPILPQLPAWIGGLVWAPDVQQLTATRWALYFTALVNGSNPPMQCIGLAIGDGPLGPFTGAPQPVICQTDHFGSIDPRTYVDPGGHLWIDWKSDDNADPDTRPASSIQPTHIWAARLSTSGYLASTPVSIFSPDRTWQDNLVESPDMFYASGTYWLIYSANWFNQPEYAIGIAACQSPVGPCSSVGSGPFLGSNAQGEGPGEPSVFVSPSGVYIAYTPSHASAPAITPPRPVALARIGISAGEPYLAQFGN